MTAAGTARTVLHVLGELRASGAEVMLRAAAPLFADAGVRTVLLATTAATGPYTEQLARAGFDIRHAPPDSGRRQLQAFDRLLRELRPAVVHVHTERAAFWYAVLARRRGARVIRTVHSVFTFDGALRVERTTQRAAERALGVRHVAISAAVAENERERFRNPCVLVPNWIDTPRFRPPTPAAAAAARRALGCRPDEFVVSSVGNCAPAKNHGALLTAVAGLPDDLPWTYLHAGFGSEDEERLADELGVRDRCRFLGQVEDVVPVLHASDLYLMPSTYEGLGNAALEALATGRRCLVSDVAGLRGVAAIAPADAVRVVPADPGSLTRHIVAAAGDTWSTPDPAACHEAVRRTHGMAAGVAMYLALYGWETPG